MSTANDARALERLLAEHRAAVEAFARKAAAVAAERWDAPRAPGKWSPAQQVKHVATVYEIFTRELRGGAGARLRGGPLQRRISRSIARPLVLATGRIPGGVTAPREVRPPEHPGDQRALVDELWARVAELEAAVTDAWSRPEPPRVTHPYFGELTLAEGMRFCAIHTRHHAGFLPG